MHSPPITILLLKSPSLPTDPYITSFPPPLYSTPILIPPLITTLHPARLVALLSSYSLLDYSSWIFTSQRAVRSLILAFEQQQQDTGGAVSDERKREIREKCRMPLFAVGPGTAGILESEVIGGGSGGRGRGGWMGGCWVEGREAGRGEKLVPIIVSRCNMEDEGVQEEGRGEKEEEGGKKTRKKKKVLWLTGEKRREGLRTGLEDAGIDVDCCIVYSTSVSPDFLPSFTQALCKQQRLDEQQLSPKRRKDERTSGNDQEEEKEEKDEIEEERVRWIVVFSTQGSREILMALGWLDEKTGRVKRGFDAPRKRRTFVASIGRTTAGYFEEEFSFTVDVVAERPSPEGVREGIEAFMGRRGFVVALDQ